MNIKKILSILAASVLALSSAAEITASANNHGDSSIGTNFRVSRYNHFTSTRQKLDATSATVKISRTNPNSSKSNVYVYDGNGTNRTYGRAKVVGYTDYYVYLPNTVYESGQRSAKLNFTIYSTPNGQSEFTMNGVWSPDSI